MADGVKTGDIAQRPLLVRHLLRKVFLEDWVLKLTALIITFGLWFGVKGLSTPMTKDLTDVPLYASIPNNTQITNALIPTVTVVISGDKRRVEQLNRAEIVATLDLTDQMPGSRVITLSAENVSISLPEEMRGIKLLAVRPSSIPLNLEAVEEKDLPVDVRTSGQPAAGYEVYSQTAIPARIRVRGPASVVRSLDAVETKEIDIAGKSADFTAPQVPVGAEDQKTAVLTTVVDVLFRIGEKRVERTLKIPVAGQSGKFATVTIFGPRTLISKATAESMKVDLRPDETGAEAPQLNLPTDLQDKVEVRKISLK